MPTPTPIQVLTITYIRIHGTNTHALIQPKHEGIVIVIVVILLVLVTSSCDPLLLHQRQQEPQQQLWHIHITHSYIAFARCVYCCRLGVLEARCCFDKCVQTKLSKKKNKIKKCAQLKVNRKSATITTY